MTEYDLSRVARLAMLPPETDERTAEGCRAMLEMISVLKEADLPPGTAEPAAAGPDSLRADAPVPGMDRERLLGNAAGRLGSGIRVPAPYDSGEEAAHA